MKTCRGGGGGGVVGDRESHQKLLQTIIRRDHFREVTFKGEIG